MTQEARMYQIQHGHKFTAIVEGKHGVRAAFKYGIKSTERKARTTVVHGITGSNVAYEIETVNAVELKIGDILTLSHVGKKSRVLFVEKAILNDVQLRFVTYDQADKVTTIGIENLES